VKTFSTDRFANEGRNSSCDETSRVELVGMRETYAPVATVPLLTSVAGLFRLLARTLILDIKKGSAGDNSFLHK